MFDLPLAPHEIDLLPTAPRIHATIESAAHDLEFELQSVIDKKDDEANALARAVDDLYGELGDLVDAVESEDPDEIEKAVKWANLALERNTD